MKDLKHILGSRPSGVSGFHDNDASDYALALFQQLKAATDSDANSMQVIQSLNSRRWVRYIGDGFLSIPNYTNPITSPYGAAIHLSNNPLMAVCDGMVFPVYNITDGANIFWSNPRLVEGETVTTLTYIEVWSEEIQPTQSPEQASNIIPQFGNIDRSEQDTPNLNNDLMNATWGAETSRRVQHRYRVVQQEINYPTSISAPIAIPPFDMPIIMNQIVINGYAVQAGSVDGSWRCGDGSTASALALKSVDGYRRIVPLALVSCYFETLDHKFPIPPNNGGAFGYPRVSGSSTRNGDFGELVPATEDAFNLPISIWFIGNLITPTIQALAVDNRQASGVATPGRLYPLDPNAKLPNSVLYTGSGNGFDADTVDGLHAGNTANSIPVLDSNGKFPTSLLRTGHGNGLNADRVDSIHAGLGANLLPPLNASGKFPASLLKTGSGNGLDADTVSGIHAGNNPLMIPVLDSGGKFPVALMPTGLNLDRVDSLGVTATAGSSADAGKIPILNNAGRVPIAAIPQGPNSGLNLDFLDGQNSTSFAPASHNHSGTYFARSQVSYVTPANFASGDSVTLTIANYTPWQSGDLFVTWSVMLVCNIVCRIDSLNGFTERQHIAWQLRPTFAMNNGPETPMAWKTTRQVTTLFFQFVWQPPYTADGFNLIYRSQGGATVGSTIRDIEIGWAAFMTRGV